MKKITLIITEKPIAAEKIAIALSKKGDIKKNDENRVPYYKVKRFDTTIIIFPAIGHLYTVSRDKEKKSPFHFKWKPLHEVKKNRKNTYLWLKTISELANKADFFIDACDYDVEGSIIGYNILKYACKNKDKIAMRMKYSTLTKVEIETAYNNLSPHLDFSLIEAGLARHEIDWLYGVNLSKILTTAIKNYNGSYITISIGRVQGPTLNFLVNREKMIKCFVSIPSWNIKTKLKIKNTIFTVEYEKNSINTLKEALKIIDLCKDGEAKIEKIEKKESYQMPPNPFDFNSLQIEAYKLFKYEPLKTARIAQKLYLNALISYPRTSSQKLPKSINYKSIFKKIGRINKYKEFSEEFLREIKLEPKEGEKTDPAHPAIYPTGNFKKISKDEEKIFDLIVRRFMATFGKAAIILNVKNTIKIKKFQFHLKGRQILMDGWLRFYRFESKIKKNKIPYFNKDDKIQLKKIILNLITDKKPTRYNSGNLLRKMEIERIGTKTTRSNIIHTLHNRKYIKNEGITVTNLGSNLIEIMKKYCPEIISIEFTRELEEKMNKMQKGEIKRKKIISEVIEKLEEITKKLKEQEKKIGKQLSDSIKKIKTNKKIIGKCPICKKGELLIIKSRKTKKRFIGCSNYFKNLCKTSFPLPQKGTLKSIRKKCINCNWPIIQVKTIRRESWELCFNPNCKSKKQEE